MNTKTKPMTEVTNSRAWALAKKLSKAPPYCGYGFFLPDGTFLRRRKREDDKTVYEHGNL